VQEEKPILKHQITASYSFHSPNLPSYIPLANLDAALPAAVRATIVPKDGSPVAGALGLVAHGRSAGSALLFAADASNTEGLLRLGAVGLGGGGVSCVNRLVSKKQSRGIKSETKKDHRILPVAASL
jgi:hypothetical protein